MSRRKYTWNAFESALTGSMSAGATTITLDSTTNLRQPGYLVVDPDNPTKREYFSFTTINGLDLEGLTRNLGGSVGAVAHDVGAVIRGVMMHQFIDDIFADVEDLETADSDHEAASNPHPIYQTETESDARYVKLAGSTMTGALAMGTNKVTGVGNPTAAQDAMTKAFFDANKGSDGSDHALESHSDMEAGGPDTGEYAEWDGAEWKFRNFDFQVRLNPLNQMAVPTGNVDFDNVARLLNVVDPIDAQSAATKNYVDLRNTTLNRTRLALTSPQAIPSSTSVDNVINWTSEVEDSGNWHSNSVNPSRVTPGVAGLYYFEVQIRWAAYGGPWSEDPSADKRRQIMLFHNTNNWAEERKSGNHTGHQRSYLSGVIYLTNTDYLEVKVIQDSGVSLNVETQSTRFRVYAL